MPENRVPRVPLRYCLVYSDTVYLLIVSCKMFDIRRCSLRLDALAHPGCHLGAKHRVLRIALEEPSVSGFSQKIHVWGSQQYVYPIHLRLKSQCPAAFFDNIRIPCRAEKNSGRITSRRNLYRAASVLKSRIYSAAEFQLTSGKFPSRKNFLDTLSNSSGV